MHHRLCSLTSSIFPWRLKTQHLLYTHLYKLNYSLLLWLPVTATHEAVKREAGSGEGKLVQVIQGNTQADRHAHLKRKKTYRCQSMVLQEQTSAHKQKHLHTLSPALITVFHSFQLLSFTSANHFSVKHESQPGHPCSASVLFFTLCISGQIRGWERSRNLKNDNGGNDDNEGDECKSLGVCVTIATVLMC